MRYLPYSLTLIFISCLLYHFHFPLPRRHCSAVLPRRCRPHPATSDGPTCRSRPLWPHSTPPPRDTMLRCWAPPLEAVDHLRCPLRCPPRPYFPSHRIVRRLLLSLVVLSTTRDCLTCSLLFVSVDADRPRLAGVDSAPSSPQHRHVNKSSCPHRTAFFCCRPAPPRHCHLPTPKERCHSDAF